MNFKIFVNKNFPLLFLSFLVAITSLAMDDENEPDTSLLMHVDHELDLEYLIQELGLSAPPVRKRYVHIKTNEHDAIFHTPQLTLETITHDTETDARYLFSNPQPDFPTLRQLLFLFNIDQNIIVTDNVIREQRATFAERYRRQFQRFRPKELAQHASVDNPEELKRLAQFAQNHGGIACFTLRDPTGNELRDRKGQLQLCCGVTGCEAIVTRSSDFTKHFRNHHLYNANLRHVCTMKHCLFGFADVSDLHEHMKSHTVNNSSKRTSIDNTKDFPLCEDDGEERHPRKRAKHSHNS